MKCGTLSGVCNTFATWSGAEWRKDALYKALLRHSVYLTEFDGPRNRYFFIKIVEG